MRFVGFNADLTTASWKCDVQLGRGIRPATSAIPSHSPDLACRPARQPSRNERAAAARDFDLVGEQLAWRQRWPARQDQYLLGLGTGEQRMAPLRVQEF